MQDAEFHDFVDAIIEQVEDQLDELDEDIDLENSGGVLTITLPNGTSVILSRQIANHEIWVAAKSGGFHLALKDTEWFCQTTKEDLATLLSRVVSEQLGQDVQLSLEV